MKARMKTDRQEVMKDAEKKASDANNAMFDALCKVAREKNTPEFDRLFRKHFEETNRKLTFDYLIQDQAAMHDRNTVMMQMAMEGEHDAVNWLVSEFKVSPKKAVEGYARVGNVEKVEEFLRKGNFRDEAARGYAFAGNVDGVNNLIERGISLTMPAYGYGRAGNLEEAKKLFDSNKADKNNWKVAVFALEGFAHSLHYKCTQDFILHAASGPQERDLRKYFAPILQKQDDFSRYCDAAVAGFAGAKCFTHEDKLLELLASTDNDAVKGYYVGYLTSNRNVQRSTELLLNHSVVEIARQADVIRAVMSEQTCDFAAAREFMAHQAEEAALAAAEQKVKEPVSEMSGEKDKQEAVAEENKKEEAAPEPKPALEKSKKQFFGGLFNKHNDGKVAKDAAKDTCRGNIEPSYGSRW